MSAAARRRGWREWLSPARAAVAAGWCLLSVAGVWLVQRQVRVSMIDVMVYRAAGWTVRTGGDLYSLRADGLPMTYPPFAGLLFVPLTWLDVGAMRTAATVANLLLAVAFAALSLRLVDRRPTVASALLLTALVVWCEPVWATLRYGQVNLLLAVLVLADLTCRADRRWAGVGIGIAAGIKLTPVLFVALLALAAFTTRGRGTPYLRRASVAAGTFAATVGVAALALPHDSVRYWTQDVFSPDRAGYAEEVANQSLRGVLARLTHSGDPGTLWLCVALAVALAGLAVAVGALTAGDRLPFAAAWAAVSCGVTALLVSPVSWTHHWVWAVPMAVLLVAEGVRRHDRRWVWGAAAAVLVFCSYALWALPHGRGRPELRENPAQMLLAACYPLAGLAFLAVAGRVVTTALRTESPPPARAARSRGARLRSRTAGSRSPAGRAGKRRPAPRRSRSADSP
ncbi:glycosyltransferase 87 family protein [Streptomyces sp. NPDC008079]|uniref:glycosyltransferase 87 family protein n=1 Tax=Streptomyces sp. NPDC008079 TaxID=3364806 RepID=UPI0036E882D2